MNDSPCPFKVWQHFGRVYTPICFGNFFECLTFIWDHEEDYYCDYYLDSNPFPF